MWGLVDCDNCFCSCERVFRPDLIGKPIVVLSNNDGCVVARSNEARTLGVRMGIPYYQMLEQFPNAGITAFSSNYNLYNDMSNRVMSILRAEAPEVFQYSIDEAFLLLRGMDRIDLHKWGEQLSAKILQWLGMPVSIGIASTKTLAKIASKFAKKYPGYHKCCIIANDNQRISALKLTPVEDVWGIGRRMASTMNTYGIATAYDFSRRPQSWVKRLFTITGERTWRELNGEDVTPVDEISVEKKSIMTSRSFPRLVTDLIDLKAHIANFAGKGAEKLRRQKSVCATVTAFMSTNPFRDDLPQYNPSDFITFPTPTDTTQEIVAAALKIAEKIYTPGYHYKRAGVLLSHFSHSNAVQMDLFSFDPIVRRKMRSISCVMDFVNARMGSDTVTLGSQQYRDKDADGNTIRFRQAIRQSLRSPDYTTTAGALKVH